MKLIKTDSDIINMDHVAHMQWLKDDVLEVHFAVPVAVFPSYTGGQDPPHATDHLARRFKGDIAKEIYRQATADDGPTEPPGRKSRMV